MMEGLIQHVPSFVLVFFRVAGMMFFVPVFGSAAIPRRVKLLLALVLAMGLAPALGQDVAVPQSVWLLALGIGGEIAFGLAMGMALSLVFLGAQWAGELVGQQMGLGLAEVFDPQSGAGRSLMGNLYFLLATVIFLLIDGHHAMLYGVRASFESLPLLSVGMNASLLALITGMFQACVGLALQLAAPVLVTMLIVELSLGFVSRTMPQMNVLSAGLPLRAAVGMIILVFSVMLTSEVVRGALLDAMTSVGAWKG